MNRADGATPLTPDEKRQLIPQHIVTRGELDALEQSNIINAEEWLTGLSARKEILDIDFIRELHHRMFGEVWGWAGEFFHEKNRYPIGDDGPNIEPNLRTLIDDSYYWIENDVYKDAYECAAEFHHRLTNIHPFPNGNGRFARILTDLFMERNLKNPAIKWLGHDLRGEESTDRKRYIEALRKADNHDKKHLIELFKEWA
jgi:Fic-DOC domain mobile mystery protein B